MSLTKKIWRRLVLMRFQLSELFWVLKAPILARHFSLEINRLEVKELKGLCNPSVLRWKEKWIVAARLPNYRRNRDNTYVIKGGIKNLNSDTYILTCNDDFFIESIVKLDDRNSGSGFPIAKNGLEDPRIFLFNDCLLGLWTATQLGSQPDSVPDATGAYVDEEISYRPNWSGTKNTMTIAEIVDERICDPIALPSPHDYLREKNWMPVVSGGQIHFVYYLGRMEVYCYREGKLNLVHIASDPISELADWSGSSQLVEWEGGWLCIAHFAARRLKHSIRQLGSFYMHRFVLISREWEIIGLSDRFFIEKRGIEFCAGLAVEDDRVVISYGAGDAHASIVELDRSQVVAMLRPI